MRVLILLLVLAAVASAEQTELSRQKRFICWLFNCGGGEAEAAADAGAEAAVEAEASVDVGASLGASASVDAGASLAAGASVGAGASLGVGAAVDAGATLAAGASVGAGASLGVGAAVDAGATLGGSVGVGVSASVGAGADASVSIGVYESGMDDTIIANYELEPWVQLIGSAMDISSSLNMPKMMKMAHKLNFVGIKGPSPVKYSFNKFRIRKFSVGQGTVGKVWDNSFTFSLSDMDFVAKGDFDFGASNLNLAGRMVTTVQLNSVKINVDLNGDKFSTGRCVADVKKINNAILNGCSLEQSLLTFLKDTQLARRQVVEMSCDLIKTFVPQVVKIVNKNNMLA